MLRFLLLTLSIALLAGCATPEARYQLTASPTVLPKVAAVPQNSSAAVNAARLRLTKNGLENPDLVSVVQITPATWASDCLDLPSGLPCLANSTAGFIIELERNGQRYLFHASQDGKQARLAKSPSQPPDDAFIRWQYSDGQACKTAVLGTEQMQFGVCGEAMLAASLGGSTSAGVSVSEQARRLQRRYAGFTAETIRGSLVFTGTGTAIASEAEQRSIAEWALERFANASYGYLPADHGLVLFWQEESASHCAGLWVYRTGLAVAWNCEGSKALGGGFLSMAQLQQFYSWVDAGKQVYVVRGDQGKGGRPGLVLQFAWNSEAKESATGDVHEQMLHFAREIYNGIRELQVGLPS